VSCIEVAMPCGDCRTGGLAIQVTADQRWIGRVSAQLREARGWLFEPTLVRKGSRNFGN
jgi:hypothetical protein